MVRSEFDIFVNISSNQKSMPKSKDWTIGSKDIVSDNQNASRVILGKRSAGFQHVFICYVWKAMVGLEDQRLYVRKLKQRAMDRWVDEREEEIVTSRKGKDFRRMWFAGRVLAGTGNRGRRRNVRNVMRNDPSIQEWAEAMARPGPEGGCMAEEVWRQRGESEGQYDRKEVLYVPGAEGHREGEIITEHEVIRGLVNMKYNKMGCADTLFRATSHRKGNSNEIVHLCKTYIHV